MARSPKVDNHTIERLLAGRLPADDAPPGYRGAAQTLRAAADLTPIEEVDATLISAMAEIAVCGAARSRAAAGGDAPPSRRRLARVAIVLGAMALPATAAGAATGSLPDPVQTRLAGVAEHVGIHLPHPAQPKAGAAPEGRPEGAGESPDAETGNADPSGAPDPAGSGHGPEISDLARTTESTGTDKGAEISEAASNGTSHAGEEPGLPAGTPGGDRPAPPAEEARPEAAGPPAETGQPDGAGRPDDAGPPAKAAGPDSGTSASG